MFDPLHQWFGIPPDEQPPNHYRLLGISALESNLDVIDTASNKQMEYLHGCSNGEHAAAAEELLNQVAAARLCLLNPESKAAYDAQLRSASAAAASTPSAVPAVPKLPRPVERSFQAINGVPDPANAGELEELLDDDSIASETTESEDAFRFRGANNSRRKAKAKTMLYGGVAVLITVLSIVLAYLVIRIMDENPIPDPRIASVPAADSNPSVTPGDGTSTQTTVPGDVQNPNTPVTPNVSNPADPPDTIDDSNTNPPDGLGSSTTEPLSPVETGDDSMSLPPSNGPKSGTFISAAATIRSTVQRGDDLMLVAQPSQAHPNGLNIYVNADAKKRFAEVGVLNVFRFFGGKKVTVNGVVSDSPIMGREGAVQVSGPRQLYLTDSPFEGVSQVVVIPEPNVTPDPNLDTSPAAPSIFSVPVPDSSMATNPVELDELIKPRHAIPDASEVAIQRAEIASLYRAQSDQAKQPSQRIALAKAMYETGVQSSDDPVGRYVLWKDFALTLMVNHKDYDSAFDVIDALEQYYDFDGFDSKAKILSKVERSDIVRTPILFAMFEGVVSQAIESDRYDEARNLVSAWAGRVTGRQKEQVTKLEERIEKLSQAYTEYADAMLVLESDTTNADAHMIAARYVCFTKGQWEDGMPHLLACNDPTIVATVEFEKEYAASFAKTSTLEMSIADGWFRVAEAEEDEEAKDAIMQRAVTWYKTALPGLSPGIQKLKAEKRISDREAMLAKSATGSGKKILSYRQLDSRASRMDSARRVGKELTVRMGKVQDGIGEAMVGVEFNGVKRVGIAVAVPKAVVRVDQYTKLGFVLDYGTGNAYTKRVFLCLGSYESQSFDKNPPWGTGTAPQDIHKFSQRATYDIDLSVYAPADWDGRCWFTVYMQNAGYNCVAQARLVGYE